MTKGALRGLSNTALIDAMRDGAPEAWQEFALRFRPLLERFGRRMRMDPVDWSECVEGVLEEAAMRWAIEGVAPPRNVAGYLMRAVVFRRQTVERGERRRARQYSLAVREGSPEGVVLSLCSEAALRQSGVYDDVNNDESHAALGRFCAILIEAFGEQDREILARLGDALPYREIAAELGVSYEAGRKRIQRLCARVRDLAPATLERLTDSDRRYVERSLAHLRGAKPGGPDDGV